MTGTRRSLPSPCNQVCVLNAEHVCVGCGRTSRDIGAWADADWDVQLAIIERAQARLAILNAQPAESPTDVSSRS